MEPATIGIIGFGALFLLIFLRLPVGFAMLLVGFVGIGYLTNFSAGLSVLGDSPYGTVASYEFCVLPLFVLMGVICAESKLVAEAYDAFYKWLGHLPGGLAITALAGSAIFSATTGSSLACAATMGKVALPEMRKYKYDLKLATGTIAAGGTLGILIPPSAGFIVYGLLTGTSIGKLFVAGVIPGLLLTLLFMVIVFARVKINPSLAVPGPRTSWRGRFVSLKSAWPIFLLFVVIIGGIYLGAFTPTEAGAVGVLGALLISLIKKQLTRKGFFASLKESIYTTGMVFIIVIGAMVFNRFMALSKLPFEVANLVAAFPWPPHFILIFVLIVLLFLGCIMESLAMILLTMPIFFPLVTALGFDPVWFGVVTVLVIEAGLITPPIGMNVYVMAGIAEDVSLHDIFRGALPFLLGIIACIVVMIFVPDIALFLPSNM